MAIAITLDKGFEVVQGSTRRNRLSATLDTSYPINGYPVTPRALGLSLVHEVQVMPQQGYLFNYDSVNQKLRVLKSTGSYFVNELTGTIVAGATYTLKYQPAYILSVRVTAGGVTGAFRVIPGSRTPVTGQVAVNMATGVMTFLAADAVTAARIVYVPIGMYGFTTDLQVVEESVTVAAGSGTLANVPACIHAIWDTSGAGAALSVVPTGQTPASGEVVIALSTGVMTFNAANTGPVLVTYYKAVGNPIFLGAQGDKTVTANVLGPNTDAGDDSPAFAIPPWGCMMCGKTAGAASLKSLLVDPAGVVAANVAVYNYFQNSITFNGADAYVTANSAWQYISGDLTGGNLQEVFNGFNLAALTGVRIIAMGS